MSGKLELCEDNDFFTGKIEGQILVMQMKENPLDHAINFVSKRKILKYLDAVEKSRDVKTLLIIGSPDKKGREDYIKFYRKLIDNKRVGIKIARLYNAINQFIIKISELNKIVIHADSGKVISLFMNTSLSCDYRIIADNTIFQNTYLDLGLIPKGGGIYYLSKILGKGKALEIIAAQKDINAKEALNLGIVDKIVPADRLKEEALNLANKYAAMPFYTISGVKQIMRGNLEEMKYSLELENKVLQNIILTDSIKRMTENQNEQ